MNQATHTQSLPHETKVSNYVIHEIIGAGGFGITYKAREEITDRIVAVKEYLPRGVAVRSRDQVTVEPISTNDRNDFDWGLDRFRQEARLLTKLKHQNIVPTLTYFEANGTGYLVMEFQDGRSLADILGKGEVLTEDELLEIVEPLLRGVEETHRHQILHRDIKPENIIIRNDGTPVLIDFGAARQALATHTHSLTTVLTPGYAPPEQYYRDGNQGPWTDIYALGAVMYRCLSAALPSSALDRLRPPDPLARGFKELRRLFSAHLIDAIVRAMEMREGERPQSIAALRNLIWPPTAETILVGAHQGRSRHDKPPDTSHAERPLLGPRPIMRPVRQQEVSRQISSSL